MDKHLPVNLQYNVLPYTDKLSIYALEDRTMSFAELAHSFLRDIVWRLEAIP